MIPTSPRCAPCLSSKVRLVQQRQASCCPAGHSCGRRRAELGKREAAREADLRLVPASSSESSKLLAKRQAAIAALIELHRCMACVVVRSAASAALLFRSGRGLNRGTALYRAQLNLRAGAVSTRANMVQASNASTNTATLACGCFWSPVRAAFWSRPWQC